MKIARALFLLPIALLLLPMAHAATPTSGTGTFTVGPGTTSSRTADGNTILTATAVATFSGVIAGTLAIEVTAIVFSSGNAVEHGTGTLTGSVLGRSGTIGLSLEATISLATGAEANFVFLSGTGTGGLANLEGHGTIVVAPATSATYSVTVIFT